MIKKNKVSEFGDYPDEWNKTGKLPAGTKIIVFCGDDAEYELILDKETGIYHEKDQPYNKLTDDTWLILSDGESVFIIQDEPFEITNLSDNELGDIDKKYLDGTWKIIGHN